MIVKPLEDLEHWFQGEIVRPHEGRTRSIEERHAAAELHVKPSRHLAPGERVDVYVDMYFARLFEVLSEEYAAVRAIAGPVEFERLVRAYLREHPSRHWSLNGLGRALPAFLSGKFRTPKKALLYDLAKLECAMAQVFDAPRSNVLVPADMARIAPESFASARVTCVSALELASFDHRANAIVRAVRQDEPMPSLARSRSFTVVWRKEWVVWRMDVSESMFAVLSELKQGRTIGQALERGAQHFHGAPEALQQEIARSFGEWIAEGLFASIEPG